MADFRKVSRTGRCLQQISAAGGSNSRGFLLIGVFMFLTVCPQLVYAQNVCSLLGRVIAAAEENPPFTSVRHLNAPNAECTVADGGRGWVCVWNDRKLKQAMKQAMKERKRASQKKSRARNKVKNKRSKLDRAFDFWMRSLDKTHGSASQHWFDLEERASAEHDRVRAEYERVKAEHERAKAAYEQTQESIRSLADDLYSQQETLKSSIKRCLSKGAIRGSWHSFTSYNRKSDGYPDLEDRREETCRDSGPPMCLRTVVIFSDSKLVLKVNLR